MFKTMSYGIMKRFFLDMNLKCLYSTAYADIPWFKINELYRKCDFSSEDDVEQFLTGNKLLDNEHFISYNKPAGIHAYRRNKEDSELQHHPDSVEEIIHLLAQKYNCPELQICNTPHYNNSGVLLFAKSAKANYELKKSFMFAKKSQKYIRTDLAITVGVPEPKTDTIKVPIEKRIVDEEMIIVPVFDPSKTKKKNKVVKPMRSHYEVLDTNQDMSLVQIQPREGMGLQSLLHLTCKLCQVLGDKKFSNKIVNINGVKMFQSFDKLESGPQKFNPKIQRKLLLSDEELKNMPLYLHRWKLIIPPIKELNLRNPTQIMAPPPEYFLLMLQILGLKMPDET